MTLQQAHEIQRKELISLRAKVARLEKQSSGLFPNEEKESLERHIRHLEQVIKTEAERHASARAHWELTDKRCFDLELENLALKEQITGLQSDNDSLRTRTEIAEKEVLMLNGTNRKLEKSSIRTLKIHLSHLLHSLFTKKSPTAVSLPVGKQAGSPVTGPIPLLSLQQQKNLYIFPPLPVF